jgi:hypothetical protein
MKTVAWDLLEQDQRGGNCGLLPFREEIRERLVLCFSMRADGPHPAARKHPATSGHGMIGVWDSQYDHE